MRSDHLPACHGLAPLFESVERDDAAKAAAICRTCPVIDACKKTLDATIRDYGLTPHAGPRGTWAGRLFNPQPRRRRAGCGTPSGKRAHLRRKEAVCNDCREADAAYKREWRASKREAGNAA